MEYQEAEYLISYFPRLMTESERDGLFQYNYHYSRGSVKGGSDQVHLEWIKEFLEKKYGYNENINSIKKFDQCYEFLITQIAQRICRDAPNEFKLNLCPNCGFIARTPYARQCRKCSFRWHDSIAGEFQLDSAFKIEKDNLYFIGDIFKGEIEVGHLIDLTKFQLNIITEIKEIGICTESMNKFKIGLTFLKIEIDPKEEVYILKHFTRPGRTIMILKEEV